MNSCETIPGNENAASLASVITTAELSRRPSRSPDFAAENRALVALAQVMAGSPDRILQKLAETALNLCRAHSAGFSLLELDGGRFYSPVIIGQWACHAGAGARKKPLRGHSLLATQVISRIRSTLQVELLLDYIAGEAFAHLG